MIEKIIFEGNEYTSVAEMPAEVRMRYQATLTPPIPSASTPNVTPEPITLPANKIVIDGIPYASVEEMPPEVQATYGSVARELDPNHDGVPDILNEVKPLTGQKGRRMVITNPSTPPLLQGRLGITGNLLVILVSLLILLFLLILIFSVIQFARIR